MSTQGTRRDTRSVDSSGPVVPATVGYLKPEEAAAYLGVSVQLLRREVREGRLTVFRPSPRVPRFSRAELDTWMMRGIVQARPEAVTEQEIATAGLSRRRRRPGAVPNPVRPPGVGPGWQPPAVGRLTAPRR